MNIIIPDYLFAAINRLCTGVESKILFTIIAHTSNKPFIPTTEYMLNMTGLTQKNHYFVNRKKLIDKGYINIASDGSLGIDINKIISDYNLLTSSWQIGNLCYNINSTKLMWKEIYHVYSLRFYHRTNLYGKIWSYQYF